MKTVTFLEKDQVWADETTWYWFDIDGQSYCIADCNGELTLLDNEGHPIDDCNDREGIKELLMPHYKAAIYK